MPKATAEERARRLLALLGQLTDGARIPIADLAAELGVAESEVAEDLTTLSLCGVAPYSPLELAPVLVEDGHVTVFGTMPGLRGPVRLSAAEARALAAALQAVGLDAHQPLTARLLQAAATDLDADELERTVRSAVGAHRAGVFAVLAHATREHLVVEIDYAKVGEQSSECREVEPFALFAERAAWYLTGWCRRAQAWRTFRLDRMRSAHLIEESFDPAARPAVPAPRAFESHDLPMARLHFSASAEYTDRDWPDAHVVGPDESGSGLIVDVPYGQTAWIARMVTARLGEVKVLSPAEVRSAVRRTAADELDHLTREGTDRS